MLIHDLIDGLGLGWFNAITSSQQGEETPATSEGQNQNIVDSSGSSGISISSPKQDLNTTAAALQDHSKMSWLLEKFGAFHGMYVYYICNICHKF